MTSTEAAQAKPPTDLYPNLGAEEGHNWRAYHSLASVRAAADLWALLYGRFSQLRFPATANETAKGETLEWVTTSSDHFWPQTGVSADSEEDFRPCFDWLNSAPGAVVNPGVAWLNTESLLESPRPHNMQTISGPEPDLIRVVHDKAFALRASRHLGLAPRGLDEQIEILDAADFDSIESLKARLESRLDQWPGEWGQRFTLKPRLGSSGRGRVGGTGVAELNRIDSAANRFRNSGGALFEPWLDREADYSAALYVPPPNQREALPTLLGSLEMLATRAGLYQGHCGEIDSRGRVFSGAPEDETLRADAAGIAALAREKGFFGPCSVDAFRYSATPAVEGDEPPAGLWRGAVEFNARATMGLATLGVLRRLMPRIRNTLNLQPGDRGAFAFAFLPRELSVAEWLRRTNGIVDSIDLSRPAPDAAAPRPFLCWGHRLAPLREGIRKALGC